MYSERELILNLTNGSVEAFNRVYDIYAKRLFAYTRQYIRSEEQSEEIVQDVFLNLWQMRSRISNTESLKSLLFKIAKSRLIDAYRSQVNSPVFEDYVAYCESIQTLDYHQMEYDDFIRLLKSSIDALPPKQKKIITLVKLEGLSQAEVAERMGLSLQTVRNLLSTGIKTLKKMMKFGGPILSVVISATDWSKYIY